MNIDMEIVFFALLAVVLLGRLWFMLGTRSDGETQRPSVVVSPLEQNKNTASGNPAEERSIAPKPLAAVLPPNSLAGGLAQVKIAIPDFDEKAFLRESRDIFSAVVMAYADGNLSAVSNFLSPEVRASFQKAVDARMASGQIARVRIVSIVDADAVSAKAEGSNVFVSVRFSSIQDTAMEDATGNVISGTDRKKEEVTDIWTFSRDANAQGASWEVVETKV